MSQAPVANASRTLGGSETVQRKSPASHVPSVRSIRSSVRGFLSTNSCSALTSAPEAVTHGMPIIAELPKKISANDSPTIASMPQRRIACGACSRDDPHPKLRLTSRIDAP